MLSNLIYYLKFITHGSQKANMRHFLGNKTIDHIVQEYIVISIMNTKL